MHIPSLATLRSFECAARHQSFTLAAQELHITQSAVSRQIKELELVTGIGLFRRVGRQVLLTQAGKRFADYIALDLNNIRETLSRAVIAGNGKEVLKIATLPTFANRWLIPRLHRYTRANPDVEINMETRLEPFDLAREKFDLAIHYGTTDWPGTRMVKLCDEEMLAVASPTFKKRYAIHDARSLLDAPLIQLSTRPDDWRNWFASKGIADANVFRGKRFDQFSMIIAAVIASLGAALLPVYLIENEVSTGQLVHLSATPFNTMNSYFIVMQNGCVSPQTRGFVNWINGEIKMSDGSNS